MFLEFCGTPKSPFDRLSDSGKSRVLFRSLKGESRQSSARMKGLVRFSLSPVSRSLVASKAVSTSKESDARSRSTSSRLIITGESSNSCEDWLSLLLLIDNGRTLQDGVLANLGAMIRDGEGIREDEGSGCSNSILGDVEISLLSVDPSIESASASWQLWGAVRAAGAKCEE